MVMTPEEIVRDYQQAKNKKNQIKILADLNSTSPSEIKSILAAENVDGIEAPRRAIHRKPNAGKTEPELEPEQEQECALPEIYLRIDAVLAALPAGTATYTRKIAAELVSNLFREYVSERLSCETPTSTKSQPAAQE